MVFKKILIGIDDNKFAEHAATYGFDIARKYNAHVGLVHIVEPAIMPQMSTGNDIITGMPMQGGIMEDMELMDIQKDQSEHFIERLIKKLAGDLQVTHFNEFGTKAEGIINCCQEFKADLIVIGTHSRTGFDRLIMGSVAEHVIRQATVPVLVVPIGKSESQ